MTAQQAEGWTRRRFLSGLTVAGTVGLLGLPSRRVAVYRFDRRRPCRGSFGTDRTIEA